MMARRRFARLVTEVFAPAPVGTMVLLLVAWHSSSGILQAIGWGFLTVGLTIVPPLLFLLRGVRGGRFSDRHVRLREQRPLPILAGLASVLVGFAVLTWLGAPRELLALIVAMAVGLIVALLITFVWKLSIHVASVAGAVVILVLVFGPPLVVLAPVVALVAWARVELGDHTPAQVTAGAAIGILVAGSVFTLLR
jgi:membrane-associated phospholipid phosphatase